MANIAHILELSTLAKDEGERYEKKRTLYGQLGPKEGRHFTGIIGSRGVGKTIMLKQLVAEHDNAIYLSLDTMEGEDLFKIVNKLHQDLGITLFLLDEVHFFNDFDAQLKKIYDFLNVKIIFTSSVALALQQSAYDLSRRIVLLPLHPFSFREYIEFKTGAELPSITLKDIIQKQWPADCLAYAHLFEEYLRGGNMPFALEEPDPLPVLDNILQKILLRDIPRVARLQIDEINTIQKMLAFIGRSEVDGINYSSVSSNLGITKYKAEAYLQLMEQAFILYRVFPKGTNVLKEPKVLMTVPHRLLHRDYKDALGALREDFFVTMLNTSGIPFHYLKSTRGSKTPDYLIPHDEGEIILEVGGKGKGRQQFKGIRSEKKIIFSHSDELDFQGIRRPLFLLGMLA